jgi:hypothetical protein
MKLRISAGKVTLEAELRDTPTTRALMEALPFEAAASTWGTQGDALALSFGRTPISTDERPKLANPCNVLGTIKDFSALRGIKAGQKIRVEKA